MEKPFNQDIVVEFNANSKSTISNVYTPQFHKVYMRSNIFYFSQMLISSYLNCHIVESNRQRKLDIVLDMNKVTVELTGFTLTIWPKDNNFLSSTLYVKYSILHKIAIAN